MTTPYYTVTEAAKVLGISVSALRTRLIKGTYPGQKVGSVWLVPKTAVQTELDSRKTPR